MAGKGVRMLIENAHRGMSRDELQEWGKHRVVYIRYSEEMAGNYIVYAADGTPLAVLEDYESVEDAICNSELKLESLH